MVVIENQESMTASMEIVSRSGLSEVAEVFVARMRGSNEHCIEFVDGLDTRCPRREKWIINVSTQFGCPVGCVFCDAGFRYLGDLTAEEMLCQVRFVRDRHSGLDRICSKLKVHFARMGEPALNDAVLEAIRRLPEELESPGLWACVPTVAPRGRDDWFSRLKKIKDEKFSSRFQLQFSVNSTDEAARRRLMPIPLLSQRELAGLGSEFFEPGDRKVVLNFALARGVPFDPRVIMRLYDPERFAVKITPVNPTEQGRLGQVATMLRSDAASHLNDKVDMLMGAGFDVILSVGDPREDAVGSNCGQAVRRMSDG